MKVSFKPREPQRSQSAQPSRRPQEIESSKPDDVIVLTYGSNSNLLEFRKRVAVKAQLEYGELGRVVETLQYPVFPPVHYNAEDLSKANDPHGIKKKAVEQRVANQVKDENECQKNKVKLYALIWSHMSTESRDIVKQHSSYESLSQAKEPLDLMKAIIDTHRFTRPTTVGAISRRDARDQYHATMMGFYESLPTFKERFATKHSYVASMSEPLKYT